MSSLKLPTKQECIQMLEEQKVHEGLMQHTLTVAKIAVFIANEFKNKGIDIDTELVERAALLHDMDKLQCLGENCRNHGKIAYSILLDKGYSKKLAELVRDHLLEKQDPADYSWELKILIYADARALEGDIVPFEKRLEKALVKYPFLDKQYLSVKMEALEKELCKKIGLNPGQIAERLR